MGGGALAPVPARAPPGRPGRGGQPERGDRPGDRVPGLRRRARPRRRPAGRRPAHAGRRGLRAARARPRQRWSRTSSSRSRPAPGRWSGAAAGARPSASSRPCPSPISCWSSRSRSSGRCSGDSDAPQRAPVALLRRVAHPYRYAVTSDGTYFSSARVSGPGIHPSLEESRVSIDEQHVACPSSTALRRMRRPPVPVETVARPFDPDELPIEADQTEEEREFADALPRPGLRARRDRPRQRRAYGVDHQHGTPAASLQPARRSPARSLEADGRSVRPSGCSIARGGVAQSVRAAGLYPAGSRFESWLPYQPHAPRRVARRAGRADPCQQVAPPPGAEAALAAAAPRATPASWSGGDHARRRRPRDRRVGRHQGRVDTDDEVQVAVGEPAADALGVTRRAVERALDRDPAIARPGLPPWPTWRSRSRPCSSWTMATPKGPMTSSGIGRPSGEHDAGRHDDLSRTGRPSPASPRSGSRVARGRTRPRRARRFVPARRSAAPAATARTQTSIARLSWLEPDRLPGTSRVTSGVVMTRKARPRPTATSEAPASVPQTSRPR